MPPADVGLPVGEASVAPGEVVPAPVEPSPPLEVPPPAVELAPADEEPPLEPLFGEKEGKIAKASRGRDPLYLFAALQRQLGYPEVPRYKPRDDMNAKLAALTQKVKDLEARIKLVEGEAKGHVDLSQYLVKPQDFADEDNS